MVVNEWKMLEKYKGLWVAVCDDKVIGHGKTLKKAFKKAVKECKEPRVFQVPENADDIYLL